jgi:hypothetical protein
MIGVCVAVALGCRSAVPSPGEIEKAMEHALLVEIPLADGGFGTPAEQEAVMRLEDALTRALTVDRTIEVDGHEFGDGKATLYIYGRDADEMLRLARPSLENHPAGGRIKVTRRYGPATDPASKEVVTGL